MWMERVNIAAVFFPSCGEDSHLMPNIPRSLYVVVFAFVTAMSSPASSQNIIIDHTNWDWYASQAQGVIDGVAGTRVYFAHASVGANVMGGLGDLNDSDTIRYSLDTVSEDGTPPTATSGGVVYEHNRGNPHWSSKITDFEGYIAKGWHAPVVDVAMNKFCYIDQQANWLTYRNSMVTLAATHPTTMFVYWTMPIKSSADSDGERHYLRHRFNEDLRNWINSQDGKILFDIADIEAWSPEGVEQTGAWEDNVYQEMYSSYTDDGGHLNTEGRVRVAEGFYSLLGKIYVPEPVLAFQQCVMLLTLAALRAFVPSLHIH